MLNVQSATPVTQEVANQIIEALANGDAEVVTLTATLDKMPEDIGAFVKNEVPKLLREKFAAEAPKQETLTLGRNALGNLEEDVVSAVNDAIAAAFGLVRK